MPRFTNRGSPTQNASSSRKSTLRSFQANSRTIQDPRSYAFNSGDGLLKLAYTQRDVFNWYEEYQYKNDAGDIFSPEWQSRLTRWGKQFDQGITDPDNTIAPYERNPENLELGLFFQAHPVAAFSLWHVLQACYKLDQLICGRSTQQKFKIAGWRNYRPFEYLLSPQIMTTWHDNLCSLSAQVEQCTDKFEKEAMGSRLHSLDRGVRSLEEALSILISIFEKKRRDMPSSYWMLDRIREGVDNRCGTISRTLDNTKLPGV